MYYGTVKKNDIANGEGVRTTLFVSGCRNKCKNCFNPETWSFTYGEPFTEEVAESILATFNSSFVTGMTILGGEPMEPENQRELLPFIRTFKQRYPKKTLWLFTGNLYEELTSGVGNHFKCLDITEELLSYVEELNSPHLGICLDTGHLNLSRASTQRDFILRAGKHLRALHIADNEGERDQHLMPFGIGSVDMKEVAGTLFEIGYDGLWNLEIPGERKTLRSVRACKLAYMKAAFDCLLQEIR